MLLVAWTSAFAAEFDVQVTSDKELYSVGETALFAVTVYKNGDLLTGESAIVEATFPDEEHPVELTSITQGVLSYESELTSDGQMTLTATVRHDFLNAIEVMEAKIIRLEEEIAELEAQLAGEIDPKRQRVLEARIDNRSAMIDKFAEKIVNFEEPEVVGMKTITVMAPASVDLVWNNCMNGYLCYKTFYITTTLGESKLGVLSCLDIPVEDADKYFVSTTPMGSALDETKTLEELGLTADDTELFVATELP